MKTGNARICENSEVTTSNTIYFNTVQTIPKGVRAEESNNLLD